MIEKPVYKMKCKGKICTVKCACVNIKIDCNVDCGNGFETH